MKVSIVIVTWNDRDNLRGCLRSVYKTKLKLEVLVVDNGSTDNTSIMLKEEFGNVQLITLEKNCGYGKANNEGLKVASGDYILLLNSDTLIIEDALKRLLDFMQKNPRVGIVGPKILMFNNQIQSFSRGYFPTVRTMFNQMFFLSSIFPKSYFFKGLNINYDTNKIEYIDWLSSCCFLIKREALEKAGSLREDFFLYFEDVEFCQRVKKHGFKVAFIPQAQILHKGGVSTEKLGNLELKKLYIHNLHKLFKENNSLIKTMLLSLLLISGFSMRYIIDFFASLIKGRTLRNKSVLDMVYVKASMDILGKLLKGGAI